jgi:nitroreductase
MLCKFSVRRWNQTLIREYTLVEAFEIIVQQRKSVKQFRNNRPIPNQILYRVLKLSQMAPSSFNLQPYKILLVKSEDAKLALSSAMIGANSSTVLSSSLAVVFLSEKGY